MDAGQQEVKSTTTDANHQFEAAAEEVLKKMWDFYPNMASAEGLHEYDGLLPDISAHALSRRADDLRDTLNPLEGVAASELSRRNRFDLRLLTSVLQKELLELTELKLYETNPMETIWHIDVANYIKRDYAPPEQRVEALIRVLKAVPPFLDSLRAGLSNRLSHAVLEASIEAYEGMASFYDRDLPDAVRGLASQGLLHEFKAALQGAREGVGDFVEHLRSLQRGAVEEFAIGADRFHHLLQDGEMVDLPLDQLLTAGERDLARNLSRFRDVANEIESSRSPVEIMKEIGKDHPQPGTLIAETSDMLEGIRQYVIDHDIISVPSEVRCITKETPAYMRWAFAAMDTPGAFETQATEAYYYVTPTEEHWSDKQKEEWLTRFSYPSLQDISIHEAYPGHYVHYLHARSAPSKISKVLGAYSFLEGWAHYTEEMMIEQGFAGGDLRLHLGQLAEALVRDCRYVCSIRMHTQGMSVEESTRYFMENAYMEELPARKEALRGTFDPMYLNYTLGKLMILKLREDYGREKAESFSIKEFHDTLLSYGAPPVPLLREMMLRDPGTDIL